MEHIRSHKATPTSMGTEVDKGEYEDTGKLIWFRHTLISRQGKAKVAIAPTQSLDEVQLRNNSDIEDTEDIQEINNIDEVEIILEIEKRLEPIKDDSDSMHIPL